MVLSLELKMTNPIIDVDWACFFNNSKRSRINLHYKACFRQSANYLNSHTRLGQSGASKSPKMATKGAKREEKK